MKNEELVLDFTTPDILKIICSKLSIKDTNKELYDRLIEEIDKLNEDDEI